MVPYVNEMAQDCIMKMTLEDKKEILEQPDAEFKLMRRLHVREQFIDHIEDRHSSELAVELSPDEFAF